MGEMSTMTELIGLQNSFASLERLQGLIQTLIVSVDAEDQAMKEEGLP